MIGRDHAGATFTILLDTATIMIFDHNGLLVHTYPRPNKGSYIPNGKPRGFLTRNQPSDPTET
jgi:putative transposase